MPSVGAFRVHRHGTDSAEDFVVHDQYFMGAAVAAVKQTGWQDAVITLSREANGPHGSIIYIEQTWEVKDGQVEAVPGTIKEALRRPGPDKES